MIEAADLIGQVWEGDFRDLAPQLPDGCVDCVVTSPPYPQGKKKSEDMGRYRRSGTAEEQRQHIHGKPNQKGETGLEVRIAAPEWLDWFLSFTPEIKRILKPNGNFIVNVDSCCYPTRHRHWGVFSLPERMEAQGWCFVDALPWIKPNGPPTFSRFRFQHSWEFVYHFANGEHWWRNEDAMWQERTPGGKVEARRRLAGRMNYGQRYGRDGKAQGLPPDGERRRVMDVFSCSVGGTRWHGLGGAHFAAMPLKLAKWIISWASKPGDIVLDPFGGAATTGVAAVALGRRPIICEVTPAAAEIARKRMERVLAQGMLEVG